MMPVFAASSTRLAVCLALAAPFVSPVLHAQEGKRDQDPGFVGLPNTGTIDASQVVATRHGAAAPRAVPGASRKAAVPAGGITGVVVENTGGEQTRVPLTFGQVFAPGDLPRGAGLIGKLADGATLPLQVDVKATHADGSVRHAVISALLPRLAKGQQLGIALAQQPLGPKRLRARPTATQRIPP